MLIRLCQNNFSIQDTSVGRMAFKFIFVLVITLLASCADTEIPSYTDSTLYVFGDSLSDVGNASIATSGLVPDKNYYNGRFTNGPNYTELLAAKFNTSIKPSRSYGSNYAFAGMKSVAISAQVFNYEENVTNANPDAIYIVWSGGNDLLELLQNPQTDLTIAETISHIRNAVFNLSSMGAVNILVPNQIDMSLLPRISDLAINDASITALSATLSSQFNTALTTMLDSLESEDNISTIRFDVNTLFADVIANPNTYSLINVSDACYIKDETSIELTGEETICPNSEEYLFWDSIHPSAVAHSIIADKMFEALNN